MKIKIIFIAACLALIITLAVNFLNRPAENKPGKQKALVVSNEALRFDFSPSFLEEVKKRAEKDRMLLAIPRSANTPAIDGKISAEEWANAATIDNLILAGNPAHPPALIRIMYDDNAVYIAAECSVPSVQSLQSVPEKPAARDSAEAYNEDCLETWICPSSKGGRAYHFIINYLGAVYEEAGENSSYDPDWSHAVGRNDRGWTAELAIPKSALQVTTWPASAGFNIGRNGPYVALYSWTGSWGDTSRGSIRLEGIREVKSKVSKQSAGTGDALTTKVIRPHARPGDRWIEVEVSLTPGSSGSAQLIAEVFPLGSDKPVAQGSITPARNKGTVLIDLRRLNLTGARLVLKLSEGRDILGTSEMFISAQNPEQPLKDGEKVKVMIDVPPGVDKVENWPVTFGVPFPAGALWDVNQLRLVDKKGKEIPCQVEATGLWARDGAVKWARFDALVSSANECFLEFSPDRQRVNPNPSLTMAETGDKITIDTGAAKYILGRGKSPIIAIHRDRKLVASAEKARGLYVVDQNGRLASAAAEEETMLVESKGPVAACVRFEGWYMTEKKEKLARHITRVETFAGQPFAKVTHTLVLCNSTTNLWFKDIGWEFAVEAGGDPTALFDVSRADWQKTHSQPLDAETPSAYMLQDEHYFFAHGTNHFAIAAVDREGKTKVIMEGEECGDFACLGGADNALMMACRDTALQHPKEFEVLSDKIILHLFSNRAGEELDFRTETLVKKWDLLNWYKATLAVRKKSDAEKMVEKVKKISSDAIGWAKTHEILVSPLAAKDTAKSAARLAGLNTCPVHALISPQWIYQSGAFGPLHPKDIERFPEAEQFIDTTFRVWEKRIKDWGNYGFVYYFTGPHLGYQGKYAEPKRYQNCLTYTLRPDLWRAYARSGDRSIRDLAEKSNLVFGDSCLAHWDGKGKVKGLFNDAPGSDLDLATAANLPFHWLGSPGMNISSSTDMNYFLYLYHLTGCRRAKEIVEEYAEGIKRFWTPAKAKRDWRGIMLMRLLVQAYGLTWDPALRELAEATTDTFVDPEGEIGLTKERPYRSTTYKTLTDIPGLFDAWEILGNPRYYDLITKIGTHWWKVYLGGWPIFYVNTQGNIGNFFYNETGNPAYAEMLALQTRQAASGYDPEKETVAGGIGAHESTFVFQGIPYSQDLMARAGADKNLVASWVAYEDLGYPSGIIIYKSDNEILDIEVKGGVDRVRPVGIGTTSGLDLNRTAVFSGAWNIRVPKDAPEGAYEIVVPQERFHLAVANARVPMVVYAPEYWRPAPNQAPPIKWYFNVPTNSRNAQIFFEGKARLYEPGGKLWPPEADLPPVATDAKTNLPSVSSAVALAKAEATSAQRLGTKAGWVDLPADKPGLWAFALGKAMIVGVKNIPPFFAARDPGSYFTPPISWERQEKDRPEEKPPAGTVYVPGAIQTSENKALYLDGKRSFTLNGGTPHSSGDGLQFLPFQQGTLEFFFKPTWDTFGLPAKVWKCFVRLDVAKGEAWSLQYPRDPAPRSVYNNVLYGYFMTDGPDGRKSMRTWRQTNIESDEWIHIAWVWGTREQPGFTKKSAIKALTTKVYVNGKAGSQKSYGGRFYTGQLPADRPKTLVLGKGIEAAFDELRVSDIQRYTKDFTPPSQDNELALDEHTRALFHFNGNVQGKSYGQTAPVMGEIK